MSTVHMLYQSTFGVELLRECLQQRIRVIFELQKSQQIFLIATDGSVQSGTRPDFAAAFVDNSTVYICDCGSKQLQPLTCNAFGIALASAGVSHYSGWAKNKITMYMPTWAEAEVRAFEKPVISLDIRMQRFRLFGGIARHIFQEEEAIYALAETKLMSSLTTCDLDEVMRTMRFQVREDNPESIVHILPVQGSLFQRYSVEFGSNKIATEFLARCALKSKEQIFAFLSNTAQDKSIAAFRGKVFEPVARNLLAMGGKFKICNLRTGKDAEVSFPACSVVDVASPSELKSKVWLIVSLASNYPFVFRNSLFSRTTTVALTVRAKTRKTDSFSTK